MRIDHVVVAIPAHNEERRIGTALAAISSARAALPPGVSSSLVVGADSCSDATVHRAVRYLAPGDRIVEVAARCVGIARRSAVAAALDAISVSPNRIWIANSDADSIVPADWLTHQLEWADRDIVGLAGIVALSDELLDRAVARRFRRTYVIRGDGSHPHVHGANLGVRADAYRSVGGWAPLPTGEDHDLWNRLRTADHRLVSTSSLVVRTSPRRRGRAPDGFADDIAALARLAA